MPQKNLRRWKLLIPNNEGNPQRQAKRSDVAQKQNPSLISIQYSHKAGYEYHTKNHGLCNRATESLIAYGRPYGNLIVRLYATQKT